MTFASVIVVDFIVFSSVFFTPLGRRPAIFASFDFLRGIDFVFRIPSMHGGQWPLEYSVRAREMSKITLALVDS